MTRKITFVQIVAALDAGKLEMQRPWGDWVPVRRRNKKHHRAKGRLDVWMENQVEANIFATGEADGFPDVRIVT